jgi:16S rRNA (cytosine967-C5)-methyltransferase
VSDLVKSSSISPARIAAFEILQRVEEGAFAAILLAARAEQLSPPDRALCYQLVMGVLRRQLWLDHLIEYYANRKVADLDIAIRQILRLGLYQLRFLSRVPASAVVNDSVNLVKLARLRSAGGLVNAVLRRAIREPEVDPSSNIDNALGRLAVATSHPAWLIERWSSAFGSEIAEAFAHSNNEPAPVSFRVVKNRAREEDVIDHLRAAGAMPVPSKIARGGWRITGAGTLLSELVARGEIYLQDEASQLVAEVLDAQPGQFVLDLCAAPGSKTTYIADRAGDGALIVASDLYPHRLRTVSLAAKTQGLDSIRLLALDGLQSLPFAEKAFDSVLVDAPCTGTGTLRRNPEIRWRISPADIRDLSARQTRLLLNAAETVKPGGRLVYSTCSVETEENEDVRQLFLENRQDFRPVDLQIDSALITSAGAARTWPHRDGTDGFFISAFERKNDS